MSEIRDDGESQHKEVEERHHDERKFCPPAIFFYLPPQARKLWLTEMPIAVCEEIVDSTGKRMRKFEVVILILIHRLTLSISAASVSALTAETRMRLLN